MFLKDLVSARSCVARLCWGLLIALALAQIILSGQAFLLDYYQGDQWTSTTSYTPPTQVPSKFAL